MVFTGTSAEFFPCNALLVEISTQILSNMSKFTTISDYFSVLNVAFFLLLYLKCKRICEK